MYNNIKPKYTNNYIQLSLSIENIQHNKISSNNSISKTTFTQINRRSRKNQPKITPIQLAFCFDDNKADGSK